MTIEGLLGRKLGTVQLFDEKGRLRGATAVEVGPCFVTELRTPEKHGYNAVQIGFGEARKLNKPEAGHLRAAGNLKLRYLAEFRVLGDATCSLGDRFDADVFELGQLFEAIDEAAGPEI